jgi:hypothetical protein
MTLWEPETRRTLQQRMARLTPAHPAKWGRMSAPQMVSHLIENMRMATGELAVAGRPGLLRYSPIKQLVIYYAPFPKGVPTAPELIARSPKEWTDDVQQPNVLIDRFLARNVSGAWPEHPAFGAMSGRAWGVLACRHIDHHLRQFGV